MNNVEAYSRIIRIVGEANMCHPGDALNEDLMDNFSITLMYSVTSDGTTDCSLMWYPTKQQWVVDWFDNKIGVKTFDQSEHKEALTFYLMVSGQQLV